MTDEHARQHARRILTEMRKRRKEMGLSQADVAERMDMAKNSISRLENSETPRWLTLYKYASVIGMRLVPIRMELVE